MTYDEEMKKVGNVTPQKAEELGLAFVGYYNFFNETIERNLSYS